MKRVEFITIEDEQDLIVSFALAPSGQHSLTLLRSPHLEFILPEEERGTTVSFSAKPEDGDLLKSVLWQGSRVEVKTERHLYTLDVSSVAQEEIAEAQAVLRKMAQDGAADVRVV